MPYIALENLTFRYDDMDMCFDLGVEAGSIVTVTGPSGAGKSTLLNLVAGFEAPTGGHLSIGGQDMAGVAPADRPVMMLFQDHNLFAHMDVFANVALGIHPGLKLTEAGRGEVMAALNAVGLGGKERRLPGQLSGGERQRVALARFAVLNRPVALLDEPFASLGPGLRAEMLGLVADMARANATTVLLVSHNPVETRDVADLCVFVEGGHVRTLGSVDEIIADPNLTTYLGNGTMGS